MTNAPEFVIASAAELNVTDDEISQLLNRVYVAGGFTDPARAADLFIPALVRARGEIICARSRRDGGLAGMVIIVPPDSPAIKLATGNTAEAHLLGVMPDYRGLGLGRKLVDAVIGRATQQGCGRLMLWTQQSMEAAQHLYESCGFVRTEDLQKDGHYYGVYELSLGG